MAMTEHLDDDGYLVEPPVGTVTPITTAAASAPPHDLRAETALLGAALMSADAAHQVIAVGPSAFYSPAHAHIADAIATLTSDGHPADVVTVAAYLGDVGLLADIGGPAVLVQLQTNTPAIGNAGRYADIVRTHAARRHIIATARDLAEHAHNLGDPAQLAAQAVDTYTAVNLDTAPRTLTLADGMVEHIEILEQRFEHGPGGIPTGWVDLDAILGGLHPGQLVTVAGRPSMGKSVVAGTLALNTAGADHPTLVVSVEMGRSELNDRYLASLGKIQLDALRSGRLGSKDWETLSHAIADLGAMPLHVCDDPNATVATIRREASKIDLAGGLIIVDYLQILTPTTRNRDGREREVAEMSAALKRLARDLEVPVVVLAQLNRGLESRLEKRPLLSDLRESGAIENDSDVVIGLYRDEVYKPDTSDKGIMEMIVLKQRNGPIGTAKLAFLGGWSTVANMARGT